MTIYQHRIQQVRKFMRERLATQGVIIPKADVYQSEYVTPADERLSWLTGFTGSAGYAIVLQDAAALFVDGRYILQAEGEVDPEIFSVYHSPEFSPKTFLKSYLKQGDRIGFDPWLMAKAEYDRWQANLKELDVEFVPIQENPVDVLWHDRPQRPLSSIKLHDQTFAGLSVSEKLNKVQNTLKDQNHDLYICNAPESICWLLNIRGEDFPYTPFIDAFALIPQQGKVDLFIDSRKIPSDVSQELEPYVTFREYGIFGEAVGQAREGSRVLLDVQRSPLWLSHQLTHSSIRWGNDPCALMKAVKNPIEREGIRQAHIKDGVAVTKFLAWLSQRLLNDEPLEELILVDQLEHFRKLGENYKGPSFSTIAGFGSNGAIIHYRPTPETNKIIEGDNLLLLDSGGQYLEGTTDITRTIAIGTPNEEHKDRFTRVLKGHIALATAVFPRGTTGSQLDALARQPLWQAGLDYQHGTGHGVGCYLSVHEGPQRISKTPSLVELQEGMVLSNEPGYYKPHHYGIRIENLILVRSQEMQQHYELSMLGFETLTLVPIDTRLIVIEMLTTAERQWLNDYHAQVRETLLPHLDTETAAWLIEATEEV